MSEKLRLKGTDAMDLGVISACLQDARISLREMVFEPDQQRFMAAFNRYRRERQPDPANCEGLTECLSVLTFEGIDAVKHKALDPDRPDRPVSLLTIATSPGKDHLIHIDLVFEGDAQIQLRTDRIEVRLEDFGEPAPCAITPCDHEASVLPGWTTSYDVKA